MFIGPILTRELISAPRRAPFYAARALYVAGLWLLVSTAWLVLTSIQPVRNPADLAQFGQTVFQILAPLQLTLAVFCSALFAASAVAHEKDRGTLDLLMMTSLYNRELVLGKLCGSLVSIVTCWAASAPLFLALTMFGGVSWQQVSRMFAVTGAAILAAGSLGSTIALWREKTFQTLALTALILAAWLAGGEVLARGASASSTGGWTAEQWAASISPLRAVIAETHRAPAQLSGSPLVMFLAIAAAFTIILNGVAIWRVRVWNPQRDQPRPATVPESDLQQPTAAETATATDQRTSAHRAPGKIREVWPNPVLWREIRTWAYGRRILLIRAAYWLVAAGAFWSARSLAADMTPAHTTSLTWLLAALFVLSLVLVNALSVTSLTSERDGQTLDLLLVTDLSAKEFVFGKLCGVLYGAKEMVLLPMALCVYLAAVRGIAWENAVYLILGLAVMLAFVAVLGIHAGMTYASSRAAIGASLGSVFFLVLGIATCMRIMVAFSGSFQLQLAPFLAFMLGGGLGLFFALGKRNPSPAIFLASMLAPIATFWAITSFLMSYTLGVLLVTAFTYGFATVALLMPAVYEFDVATGRTTGGEE